MKRISSLLFGLGIAALQGCSAAPTNSEDLAVTESAASGSATISITSDWGSGYCANVVLTNALTVATTRWQVIIDLGTTVVSSAPWGTTFSGTTGMINAHPAAYNTVITANGTTSFGFCGSATSTARPKIKAYNMEMDLFTTCQTNSGINPAKAALAVAMATELGRIEPLTDLALDANWKVVLAPTAVCLKNSCKNTKAILGQQDYTADISVFDNTQFWQDSVASFQRQRDFINNLVLNAPAKLPITNYKMTLVGGPTSLGYGNCGPHYIFQVDYSSGANSGKPLSATDATNLGGNLCYFGDGGGSCGNNPYISYITTGLVGCPTGKTCVALDPTDGDVSSTSTTTAGSAPTYPANRVWDPANSLLNTSCITTGGKLGTLIPKCAAYPTTCGYLYCTAI